MTEESNLSEKIDYGRVMDKSFIHEKDVKEFIRLLKEKIRFYRTATYNLAFLKEMDRFIDKLAGDDLK